MAKILRPAMEISQISYNVIRMKDGTNKPTAGEELAEPGFSEITEIGTGSRFSGSWATRMALIVDHFI